MRILMVSDVYFPRINGVSTSIHTFRTELSKLDVEVTLIAPAYDGLDKPMYDIEEDIVRVPSRRVLFDPEDRIIRKKYIGEIFSLLSSKAYDIVHIQTPFVAHYLGMALAEKLNIPVVETYHTFFEEYFYHYIPFLPKAWLRFAARWFSRTQCNRLDALVVPSSAMHRKLQDYGVTTDMSIIPTGVTMTNKRAGPRDAFLSKHRIPAGRPIMLHIGRVAFEKNIGFLLEMYGEVRKSLPDTLLVIAGEGPARKSLQKKANKLGIQDGIYFVGYLSREHELPACYQAGDVFVFASRTETQGLVLLEAMAMGLPVVSTAEMGTRDILLPEQGAVIASEDKPDFSGKVVSLLNDRLRLKKMSAEAIDYADKWSSAAMAEKMYDFYQGLTKATIKSDQSSTESGIRLVTEKI